MPANAVNSGREGSNKILVISMMEASRLEADAPAAAAIVAD